MFLRTFLAHAATILEEGVSGTHGWKYEEIDGEIVFTLYPTTGEEGLLEDWANDPASAIDAPSKIEEGTLYYPGWRGDYHQSAARIVVKGRVKARTCRAMFSGFRQAVSADLSGSEVTGVQSMRAMFCNCLHLPSLDVSNWDVSFVITMRDTFCGCSSLTSLDVSNWDVSSTTDVAGMFAYDISLVSLNLSSWDMGAVEHSSDVFSDMSLLRSVRLGEKVCIANAISFGDAGSNIGIGWR